MQSKRLDNLGKSEPYAMAAWIARSKGRPGDWMSRRVEKNVRCISTERQLAGANLAHLCDEGVIR